MTSMSSPARDPQNKLYFSLRVEGFPYRSNIWVHGTDARTFMPQPAQAVADQTITAGTAPRQLDARIQILWPHGNAPVAQASLANLSVDLFRRGTLIRLMPGGAGTTQWVPKVWLLAARNNDPGQRVAQGVLRIEANGAAHWDFNDIDVSPARDPETKLHFWVEIEGCRRPSPIPGPMAWTLAPICPTLRPYWVIVCNIFSLSSHSGGIMTRIVTDTTCGLTFEMTRSLGIPMISQIINFGADSYREGPEIDFATFMQRLRTDREIPKTAAPYPGDFIEVFREIAAEGESMVCIHPSSDVSGTVRSAFTAKESFPDADIRIIDTRTVAGPLGTIVLEADKLAKAGATADEVEALVYAMMPRARIYFLVDTLEFLRRGGRIGGAAALVGSILQVKPILIFREGRVDQFEKERTKKRALARIKEVIINEAARGARRSPHGDAC